jgi:hypothetical protein
VSQAAFRALFDCWNRRDIDAQMAYVADGCHYNDFSFVRPHVGGDEVRALFDNVAARVPDLTFEILDLTGDHDVAAYWEVYVKDQPTGRRGVSYSRFDDDDKLLWALDAADPGPEHRVNDFHTAVAS